jgi:hypothetical protein
VYPALRSPKKKLGLNPIYDLSATHFFLRGSGYADCTYQFCQSAKPIASLIIRSTKSSLKGWFLAFSRRIRAFANTTALPPKPDFLILKSRQANPVIGAAPT